MTSAPFGRRAVTVTARERVGAYVVLRVADADGPQPLAGQFYMLASRERWGGGERERPFLPRAFSVLRAAPGRLDFLLEAVGPGTARLDELEAGDELWITGPLGRPFAPPAGVPLLIGGGVGIAPLAILQDELVDAPALVGFRDADHAAAAGLLRDVTVATDDGSVGAHGLVTELLEARLRADVTVYACGPPAMLETVRSLCASAGVAAELALEAPMACGFGACYGCVVATRDGYRRVCVDGPVFAGAALEAVA
jgi:NAD(P)H-flavin reductase